MDDFDMAKYPGLTLRNGDGMWQVRKRIPVDLRHIDGRGSVRKTLGTRDKREAKGRYHLAMAEIEAGFDELRAKLRSRPIVEVALSTGRIEDLGRAAIEGLIRDWWRGRSGYRQPTWLNGQCVADAMAALEEDAVISARTEDEGRDLAGELADRLLVDAGAASSPRRVGRIKTQVEYPNIDRETSAYQQLHALVRQGLQYEMMLAKDHLTGDRITPPHSIFNPQGDATGAELKTVGDLIRDYRLERERLRNGVESTARRFGLLFRLIEEEWGADLLVVDVTRQRCVDLVTLIQRLPANGTKKFRSMTFRQSIAAADAGEHKRLAPNSVGTYVNNLCALLRWGKKHNYGVTVNTDGLKPGGGAEVERRGMTPSELNVIFHALAGHRENEPHKFWVPALAAYTGARAEELCQLRREDVIDVDGIYCLNLTRFDPTGRVVADKRFKNRGSERLVPIHDELIGSGFLAFAETGDPQGRLFPALKPSTKGNYSHNLSKWFARFMDRTGYSDPSLVFHSFRHGFRDACRDADILEETAHALGGWTAVNQGQKYGKRGAVPRLHKALKKVGFDGFRLTDLLSGN